MLTFSVRAGACLSLLAFSSLAFGQADLLPSIPRGTISIGLSPIATGLGAPVYAINAPGDPNRLFVLEQKGTIRLMQNGSIVPTPSLDIQTLITGSSGNTTFFNPGNRNDERGLLGLAFHPGYNSPGSPGFGTLYTYNSQPIPLNNAPVPVPDLTVPTFVAPNNLPAGTANINAQIYMNVVNEWKISATDPNIIDPNSKREVVSFSKQATNHNGGTIAFGPDGYLYMGLGDGGNAYDVGNSHTEPGGNGQDLSNPLGKMLRIDPLNPTLNPGSVDPLSSNQRYRIPADNPFQGANQVKEIYAYGLRNPYRFSFDGNNLIAADVGQGNIEEIDLIVKGGNYGWALKEGDFTVNRVVTVNSTLGTFSSAGSTIGTRVISDGTILIDPIRGNEIDPGTGVARTLQYDHQDGISITGGFVYRGSLIPELEGKYVFGDLAIRGGPRVDGRLFYADLVSGQINEFLLPQFVGDQLPNQLLVYGFGQDFNGELYALATNSAANGTGGIVFAITAIPEPSAFMLVGVGVGLVGFVRRKRRNTATNN